MRGLGDNSAKRIAKDRAAPEFQSSAGSGVAPDVTGFKSHTVDDGDVHAVGDGVGTLNGSPGVVLSCTELGLFRGMPSDGSGIKQHVSALQCGDTGALGIPLVPANERSDPADIGIEGAVAKVAGSEVELFIVKRIVRNVHLSVK